MFSVSCTFIAHVCGALLNAASTSAKALAYTRSFFGVVLMISNDNHAEEVKDRSDAQPADQNAAARSGHRDPEIRAWSVPAPFFGEGGGAANFYRLILRVKWEERNCAIFRET